jgi:hypothetical protein
MNECRLVGVAGAGRGTGATHLSILAANYLSGCRQHKTALIQWNTHGDFMRIEDTLRGNRRKGAESHKYTLLEVDYYKMGDARLLAECMEDGYDDIIIDFGEMREAVREEWLRCGNQVMTASLSEWKLEAFLGFLAGEKKLGKGWIYAAAFGSEDTRREIEKQFRITLNRIPFSVDAFCVDRRLMDWFQGILK